MDEIVQLLRSEVSRDAVQLAVAQQDSVVTQFVSLLLKAETLQATPGKKDGDAAITITGTQCKP